ncbi:MAG TPA: hypothetical protein VMB18_02705 [Terriglobales bacterium]|nr:hypothetical protein [Terriglobales bacterium]
MALAMLIAIVLIFALPRNKVIVPFLLGCLTIPIQQVVVLGGQHFTVLRILIIAALIRRAFSGGGKFPGGFNGVDRVAIVWAIAIETMVSLQWMEAQVFVHNLGDLLDMLGGYLVIRFFIPDGETVRRTIKTLVVICIIQGVCMLNEQISHINVFGYVGGLGPWLTMREGSIRSEGAWGCISAGAFGGALIPLFLGLWTDRENRTLAIIGVAAATTIVITSNSSTSLLALAASVLAIFFWPIRKQMRLVRWAIVLTLVALHLVMKGPVWALITHIDLTGSSSSYHRYYLVDNCIRHFSEWWLMGYKDYNKWGFMMFDMCNQFVVQAVNGGLLGLVAYIMIFSRSFGAIGRARRRVEGDRRHEWFLWCLGSSLFSVVVAHFGINYPATMEIGLFTLWVCASVAASEARQPVNAKLEIKGNASQVPELVGAV